MQVDLIINLKLHQPMILTPSPPPTKQRLPPATTAADSPTNFKDVDNNINDEIGGGGTVRNSGIGAADYIFRQR